MHHIHDNSTHKPQSFLSNSFPLVIILQDLTPQFLSLSRCPIEVPCHFPFKTSLSSPRDNSVSFFWVGIFCSPTPTSPRVRFCKMMLIFLRRVRDLADRVWQAERLPYETKSHGPFCRSPRLHRIEYIFFIVTNHPTTAN